MLKRPLCLFCLVFAACIYLGTVFFNTDPPDYSSLSGKEAVLTGKVYRKEFIKKPDGLSLVLYVKPAGTNTISCQNVICYMLPDQKEPETGSLIKIRGNLSSFEKASNPGQFDALLYYRILNISFRLNQAKILAKSIEYNKLTEALFKIRRYFSSLFELYLSSEQASVMKTMLLGQKGELDTEIKLLYQQNGIAHILAISGLHISILGMGFFKLLKKGRLPQPAACFIAIVFMLLYGLMTGFAVSSLRAVLMFAIHMAAYLSGRTYDMLTAAAVAAVFILIGEPLYFYNSSFLFTFGCVITLGLLVPVLNGESDKKKRGIKRTVFSGIALWAGTLPLNLWFFYQVPPYSVLLNLIVIPCMSILMAAGILLLLVGSAVTVLNGAGSAFVPVFSWTIGFILKGYEICCRFCEKLPFHLIIAGQPASYKIIIYIMVLLLIVLFHRRISLKLRWYAVLPAVCFLMINGNSKMSVTFLDVGQGDCIHIEAASGKHYLVDGGSSSVKSAGTYRIMPYLKYKGITELEAVFITHPDEDHCNGIKELLEGGEEQGIKIKAVILPDIAKEVKSSSFLMLEEAAAQSGADIKTISRGQGVKDGRMKLTCLHPVKDSEIREPNNYSVVLSLTYGGYSALLTGDLEEDQDMAAFMDQEKLPEHYTVLKAAHHGSGGATGEKLLTRTQPDFTVISCGKNNSYGHPHKELLDRVSETGSRIYITYETGAVSFITDGEQMKIIKFLN